MTDQELERRVSALTLMLGKVLDGAPDDVLARAMSEFPDILLTELRRVEGIGRLEAMSMRDVTRSAG
jgi:hypothetical protein